MQGFHHRCRLLQKFDGLPGLRAFVRCAVTGVPVPLEELKYWSVDLQEAYATPEAVLRRLTPPRAK